MVGTMADLQGPPPASSGSEASSLESTSLLLERIRGGDAAARERLFARVLPALTRWAHRRLPARMRDLSETEDLVQLSLMRALSRLDSFEAQREGAFLAYLREILKNLVRDEARRVRRREVEPLSESREDPAPSPLERTVSRDVLDRYERALEKLSAESQQAVLLRVEFAYTYPEIAAALGKASPDAARMIVGRALVEIARHMRER
jgi:RNA polymerase sigma factor (sigma-70 family)